MENSSTNAPYLFSFLVYSALSPTGIVFWMAPVQSRINRWVRSSMNQPSIVDLAPRGPSILQLDAPGVRQRLRAGFWRPRQRPPKLHLHPGGWRPTGSHAGSCQMRFTFADLTPVKIRTACPSQLNQTGTDMGDPSLARVVNIPYRVLDRNFSWNSFDIFAISIFHL